MSTTDNHPKPQWNPNTQQWDMVQPLPEGELPPFRQAEKSAAEIKQAFDAAQSLYETMVLDQDTPILILNYSLELPLTWFGVPIRLTPTQYRVIFLLAARAGEVVTHEQLLYVITQGLTDIEPAAIAWHISRIRHACSQSTPDLPIFSVARRGYILRLHPTAVLLPDSTEPELYSDSEDLAIVPDDLPKPDCPVE